MQLLTSLRISDSLQEQTSYFMAELKKLQRIVGRLRTGAPALVLIDEILRGTNSEDKALWFRPVHPQFNGISLPLPFRDA